MRGWRLDDRRLDEIEVADSYQGGVEDARVRLASQSFGPHTPPRCFPGIGIVEEAAGDSGLIGKEVIVPATIAASMDRDAPLIPLQQDVSESADMISHVWCPTRWLVPTDEGLDLPPALAALTARELVDAYALTIAAQVRPRCELVVVGKSATAALSMALGRHLECATTDISLPRVEAPAPATERTHVIIATNDAALLESIFPWLYTLQRPSIAIVDRGASTVTVDLGALARNGATISTLIGGHPDLIAEAAALVVKRNIDLSVAASPVSVGDEFDDGQHYAIAIPATSDPTE